MYTVRMSFFSSFGKKSAHERVLVLHVGSASVAGAVAVYASTVTRPRIETAVRSDIALAPEVSHEAVEAEMRRALERTLAGLSSMRLDAPDRIVVYLASPWFASQVRTARLERPAPFVVSESLVTDMIAREFHAFEGEEIAASRDAGAPLRAIESKVLSAKLNGYVTASPIGASARELELSLFVSVAPDMLLSDIEHVIERHFKKPVRFGSFLLASFLAARDLFPHEEQYILADVGGEVTEAAVIRDHAIVASASFPMGRNFLLRSIAAGTGRGLREAASLCLLHGENALSGPVKDTCEAILGEADHAWRDSFREAVFRMSGGAAAPDAVLLTGEDDVLARFAEAARTLVPGRTLRAVPLSAAVFHEKIEFGADVPRLPCIMIETLAAESTKY